MWRLSDYPEEWKRSGRDLSFRIYCGFLLQKLEGAHSPIAKFTMQSLLESESFAELSAKLAYVSRMLSEEAASGQEELDEWERMVLEMGEKFGR